MKIWFAFLLGLALAGLGFNQVSYYKSDVHERALRHKNGYWHPNSGKWKWIDHSHNWSDAQFGKLNSFLEAVSGSPTKEEWKDFIKRMNK